MRDSINTISWTNIDWKEQYPFIRDEDNTNTQLVSEGNNNSIIHYVEKYKAMSKRIASLSENIPQSYLMGRNTYLYIYGKLNHYSRMRMVRDSETTVVDIGGGYLTKIDQYSSNCNDIAVENVVNFSKWLKNRNIEFMMVSVPLKKIEEKEIVKNIIDNKEDNLRESLCKKLMEKGMTVLNIASYMPSDYDNYASKYYYTDHHWKISTGLRVSQIIADELNYAYGFQIIMVPKIKTNL